mgnify:CR=1 FL=1
MTAVLKHELRSYFHSLTAYVFGAFLLAFIGIGAMRYNLQAAVSNFEYVLSFASLVFVVIVPVLTMRVLAEERRQKTDQLLYSLPITTVQIIAGKYLALLVLYLIPLAIIAVYPLIFAQFGDVYLLTSYGSILAFFLLGAALIAVGVFLSSLTDNQGLAAGLGIAVILLNYYSVSLSEYVSSTPVGALAALLVLILAAGAVVRYLTRNSNLAYGVCLVLLAAVAALYFVDSTAFEGLLPTVMSAASSAGLVGENSPSETSNSSLPSRSVSRVRWASCRTNGAFSLTCGVTVLTVTTALSPSMRVLPAGRVLISRAMTYSMTVSRFSLMPR